MSVADLAIVAALVFVWGTLSATVLVSPSTLKDPAVSAAMDRAVEDLRYGAIGVNVWHALVFAMGTTTWGAYPGHSRTDIQSGTGAAEMATPAARRSDASPGRSAGRPDRLPGRPPARPAERQTIAEHAEIVVRRRAMPPFDCEIRGRSELMARSPAPKGRL